MVVVTENLGAEDRVTDDIAAHCRSKKSACLGDAPARDFDGCYTGVVRSALVGNAPLDRFGAAASRDCLPLAGGIEDEVLEMGTKPDAMVMNGGCHRW
ncbi:hypothetical protein ACLOJK_006482 [Asimina triloba]